MPKIAGVIFILLIAGVTVILTRTPPPPPDIDPSVLAAYSEVVPEIELPRTERAEDTSPPERLLLPDTDEPGLFSNVPEAELDHAAIEAYIGPRHVERFSMVRFNSDLLRAYIRDPIQHSSFPFQVFGMEPITLVTNTESSEEHSAGWQSGQAGWIGGVEGQEAGSAIFHIGPDGTVTGSIRAEMDGERHAIKINRLDGSDQHIMWERERGFVYEQTGHSPPRPSDNTNP